MTLKEKFIEFMVRSNVLTFGDFTTKSGRKTPYFINTGNYRTGRQISMLGEFYAEAIINRLDKDGFDFLYGPAYKGIPLAVTTATALYTHHGLDVPFSFNRKEAKDHGEGGVIISYKPKDGDRTVIIEDVITAGTSVRESVPILKAAADVRIESMIISVDRMENSENGKTAVQEVYEEFGIKVFSIVNILDILDVMLNREVDGKVLVDDGMKNRIEEYMVKYCRKA